MIGSGGVAERIVVCGSIHAHRVVVPAARVDVIGEQHDAEREGVYITDVASVLRVSPPPGPRRALRVVAGDAARWLVMGDSISVRTLPAEAFGGFPEWLTGVSASLPFSGLVALDGAFAVELDLTRLVSSEVP